MSNIINLDYHVNSKIFIPIFVCVLMQASHCPELDTRWTHDYENVQIRV